MSILYVDNLQPNLGSQVEIPNLKPPVGTVINSHRVVCNSNITLTTDAAWTDIPLGTFSYTPKQPNSLLQIEVVAHIFAAASPSAWTGAAVRCLVNGTSASSLPVSTHHARSALNNNDMAYGIDLSEYTCTSASAVTIKAQAFAITGATSTVINQYGLGYVRVMEIAQ